MVNQCRLLAAALSELSPSGLGAVAAAQILWLCALPRYALPIMVKQGVSRVFNLIATTASSVLLRSPRAPPTRPARTSRSRSPAIGKHNISFCAVTRTRAHRALVGLVSRCHAT